MHCNYDITWGDIAPKFNIYLILLHVCQRSEVTMWLSHDSSSEYALEIAELKLYYASIYNWIIVLKTAETTFFKFHSLINIPVS
jgi:hypothetical protein